METVDNGLPQVDDQGKPWPTTIGEFIRRVLERGPEMKRLLAWMRLCESFLLLEQNKREVLHRREMEELERVWKRTEHQLEQQFELLVSQLPEHEKRDHLTHLPNYLAFVEKLVGDLVSNFNLGPWGGLGFIDVDDFKAINEQIGHDAADLVLRRIGAIATNCLRQRTDDIRRLPDMAARRSGDEMLLLMWELLTPGVGFEIASRIQHEVAVHDWSDILYPKLRVTISIGMVVLRLGRKPEDIRQRKEQANHLGLRWLRAADGLAAESKKTKHAELRKVYQMELRQVNGDLVEVTEELQAPEH